MQTTDNVNSLSALPNSNACPTGTAFDELVVNERTQNGTPDTYIARTSITFEDSFESLTTDDFETIIDPEATTCDIAGQTLAATDIGDDGTNNSMVAKDAYGFTLHYYDEGNTRDYIPIGATQPLVSITPTGFSFTSLYNGNIAAMSINVPQVGIPLFYSYRYDQLNRLKSMQAYKGLNTQTNSWDPISIEDYKENITYDPNGNIKTYLRNGTGSSLNLNNYSYSYTAGTNKLQSINNSVNEETKTYSYDAIGNTTKDGMQGVTNAVWNVYGKLQSLTNKDGQSVTYTYSTDGQRISKKVGNVEEWYVKDATGNIMATYKKDAAVNNGDLSVTELYKYGSGLLDIRDAKINVEHPVPNTGFTTSERGNDNYILTDANGNTKVTISDRKIQHSSDGIHVSYYTADVRTATLHSAFGANAKTSNGGFAAANFNGQRKSLEIGADAQTARFWEYNGDVGRRWNVDPKPNISLSPYNVFLGNPVLFSDPHGDTIILGKNLLKNKYWMKAYERFSESEQGKQFLKDYGNSGIYGKVTVKFDVDELYWWTGETDPFSVSPSDPNNRKLIRAPGDASSNTISKLRKGDQLKFNVTLNWDITNEKSLKEDPSRYGFEWEVFHGLTVLHETQHVRIFTKELIETSQKEAVSTAHKQHEMMKNAGGNYFKDRYDYLDYYFSPLRRISQIITKPLKFNEKIKKNISQMANASDN